MNFSAYLHAKDVQRERIMNESGTPVRVIEETSAYLHDRIIHSYSFSPDSRERAGEYPFISIPTRSLTKRKL